MTVAVSIAVSDPASIQHESSITSSWQF